MGDKEKKITQSDILGDANKILEELNKIADRVAEDNGIANKVPSDKKRDDNNER